MKQAFKRIMTRTPKALKNATEDVNSPQAFREQIDGQIYNNRFDMNTGAHFEFEYMVNRLEALSR